MKSIWDGFDFTYILSILLSVIPALLCITLHECSHGYVAYLLGDDTAKKSGRLTLNPLKHIDLTGLIMMILFRVGWAKPVPINMFKFKNPKRGMAVSALAGPAANLITAVVFMFIFGLLYIPLKLESTGYAASYFLNMIQLTAQISVGLAVFNLIPIPPMDGSKILFSVLSDKGYYKLMRYERYGMIISVLLVSTGVLGRPLSAAIDYVIGKLMFVAQAGLNVSYFLFYK